MRLNFPKSDLRLTLRGMPKEGCPAFGADRFREEETANSTRWVELLLTPYLKLV
jgi:hypothetical protein